MKTMRCRGCNWEGQRHNNAVVCGRCRGRLDVLESPSTLPLPIMEEEWRINLRKSAMRLGFSLALSRPMLEYLSATADGVQWDRSLYFQGGPQTDNWMASQNSLIKRGLLIRKTDAEIALHRHVDTPPGEWTCMKLSPAGVVVVELIKLAGMFVESDAAINKKARQA